MKKTISAVLAILALLLVFSSAVSAESYTYTRSGEAVVSPDAYIPSANVTLSADGISATSPQDIFFSDDGRVLVADTGNNRILILDSTLTKISAVSSLKDKDGNLYTLNAPEGVFAAKDGMLYIADTGNHRLLCCDSELNVFLVVEKPKGLVGIAEDASFNPTKVLVDSSGRIYVVARNYNLGILQLDPKGNFVGYIGAPKVQYNLLEMLWRSISTEEQLSKMEQYVPTEYNNIALDHEGFVWGTIGTLDRDKLKSTITSGDTSGTVTPITKLNTNGNDVLKRNGAHAPLGDLDYEKEPSKIIDVATMESGSYAMLDSTLGHIFMYDDNGNLLCIFGKNGNGAYDFSQVSSCTFCGDDLLVLDALFGRITVFSPSDYGKRLLSAARYQYDGDFDKAYAVWSEVAGQNRNLEYAFVGLGQSYCNEGEYEKAMDCFSYADDKENYSKAKFLLRKENMKTVFPVIFISIICIAVVVFVFGIGRKFYRYAKGYSREE